MTIETYHGICYRKFPVIPPQIMFTYQRYGDQDVQLPEKFVKLLVEKHKKFDRIFEFVYCRDESRQWHSISIQHSCYDKFDYERGVNIAQGRLKRFMGKGYEYYGQIHITKTFPDGQKFHGTELNYLDSYPTWVVFIEKEGD